VFSAIDHAGLFNHELNTSGEIAMYQDARDRTHQVLGEERYAAAHAEGERLTVEEALVLVLR